MIRHILLIFASTLSFFPLFAQVDDPACDGERLVAPVFTEVQVTEDIVFGVGTDVSGNNFDLLMDVYEPVGDNLEQRPVVVLAHGGSFLAGTRRNPVMVNTCTALAERGYVAASIEYTLWPLLMGFPDSLDLINVVVSSLGDMRTAIRYFNEDGLTDNQFRVNPNVITAGGYSAGAIIASHHGIMDSTDELPDFIVDALEVQGGIDSLGTNLEYSDDVISIINLSGSIYDVDFIDENSIPIFSSHGDVDETVPYMFGITGGVLYSHGSYNITQRYNELGLENQLFTFNGGGHTDIFNASNFTDDLGEMYANMFVWNKDQVCNRISTSSEELFTTSAKIYPNPVQEELNIELPNDLEVNYIIEIFDQIGQLVYAGSYQSNVKNTININGLANGLYITKISFDEKYSPISHRIVIAK